jgi:hypothetical protein
MLPAEAKRRARARRAFRAYRKLAEGPKDEIGFPSGLAGRLAKRWLNRLDRRDGGLW